MASNSLVVASTLKNLILLAMGNASRRLFWEEIVLPELLPKELGTDTPVPILADWYEKHGQMDVATMLREHAKMMKGQEDDW